MHQRKLYIYIIYDCAYFILSMHHPSFLACSWDLHLLFLKKVECILSISAE